MNVPTFGQIVRTARVSIGFTQRKLARLMEVDFTYLSKLESDRTEYPPKEYVIQQLAHYLGLDRVFNWSLARILPGFSQAKLQGYASAISVDAARARLCNQGK